MKTIPAFLMTAALACSLHAAPIAVTNGGFEDGPAEGRLSGWFVPPPAAADGWSARLVGDGAKEGRRCAAIGRTGEGEPRMFGNLMQSLRAESVRGKRIRFSAEVRHSGPADSRSQLWFRVDRPNEQPGFFDNCADRPATTDEWRRVEIVGEVADDALALNFGLMTFGKGAAARLDDVKLEVLGDIPRAEAASALTDRGLANVTAFVRLLGYVRYFHPSDQAAALTPAEWDRLAVNGVREVEPAADAADLAARMTKMFQPIAPTVVIAAGKTAPPVRLPRGAYLRAWQHAGYGFGEKMAGAPPIYRSLRVRQRAGAVRAGDSIADPGQPWARELGGGVACSVPLTLYDDGEATLPRMDARPAPPTDAPALSARDRAVRLAAVASAWNVMQHFYPYFDIVPTDWNAALTTALRSAATDRDESAFYRTLQRLGAALHDGHCFIGGPGAPREMYPALSLAWAEGKLCVAQSGLPTLAPGDALLEIDGVPVELVVKERLALCSVPSPQGGELKAALGVLAGAPRSAARLAIEPYSSRGTRREVTVTRDQVSAFELRPKRERMKELAPGILYLDLDQWTQQEFDAQWPELEKARGLIFEFRNYPTKIHPRKFFGRFSARPVTSAQFLTPAIVRPDHTGMVFPPTGGWRIEPQHPRISCPRAFLIDATCISYAESCLSIVEHHHLGELVGTPTMGTNGNVISVALPGGNTMSFTGMKVLKQNGTPHHGVGIRPTVPAASTRKGLAERRDEVVETALAILLSKAATK